MEGSDPSDHPSSQRERLRHAHLFKYEAYRERRGPQAGDESSDIQENSTQNECGDPKRPTF